MVQTLNLANIENSDIKYHVDIFPDGEYSIVIDTPINRKVDSITVNCRINSMNNLFVLGQVADILNRQEIPFDVNIYYLMSMRMDRVMDFNRPYSLKIVSSIIKSFGARYINVLEPHSGKTLSLLNARVLSDNKIESIKNGFFLKLYEGETNGEVTYYNSTVKEIVDTDSNKKKLTVFPDAGAQSRYSYVKNHTFTSGIIEISNNKYADVACYTKKRDLSTGKIIGLEPQSDTDKELIKNAEIITLVDDLCDGGGTFVGTAKSIKEINPNVKLRIVVTHMVNPKGIQNLSANYDEVYFTNSYKDWQKEELPENVHVIEVL